MQLRLPWTAPRVRAPQRPVVDVGGRPLEVDIVRHRAARRYVLRLGPDGSLRLTVPRGASIAGGLRFAAAQHDWILRERLQHRQRTAPWQPGSLVWFRGRQVPIGSDGASLTVGDITAPLRTDESLRQAVERALRGRALAELPGRTHAFAAVHGVPVARVTVRSQRTRWGTCAPGPRISLNWRLIQMPPEVSDYVILHELMHVRQPNHSRRFWREVASVCPWWRDAERWLRKHGRLLV